jgi:Zn-dependent M28 family amino/carboxypeptidase
MGSRLAVSRWRGAERQARGESVLVGGHIDSVPGGGWLDGALNLLAGVALRSEVMQVLGDLPV